MRCMLATATAAICCAATLAAAQPATTTPASAPAMATATANSAAAADVDRLRDALKSAYQRGDVAGMLKYLHPRVVIIFPDGQILQGPDALARYYDKMLKAPGHIVQSYSSDPVVTERAIHGDTVVSFGKMNDNYVLTDGTSFGLDSRFTITALRLPDGPPETNGWVIRSFHSSTDAFDNPVLHLAVRKSGTWAGAAGALIGAIVGVVVAAPLLLRIRRRGSDANAKA